MRNITLALMLLAAPAAAAADKSAYLHFMAGVSRERKGDYDAALNEYKAAMLLDPQSVYVRRQALNLALHIGRVAEAEAWADYIVGADPSSADNWILYGNVRWAKNDIDGATKAFSKAVELEPENDEAVYQLAGANSTRDPDASIKYLERYAGLRPDASAETYFQIATLHSMRGRNDLAKEYMLKSAAEDSYYLQPRFALANHYEVSGDTAAAVGQYEELADLDPSNRELINHLGALLAGPAVGDLARAEKYFLKANALEPSDPDSCFWLSLIAEQRDDYASAIAYMERSAGLKENPGLVMRLAYYYSQARQPDKAVRLLEESHSRWPKNDEIAYFLALGLDDTGKTKRSLELMKKIVVSSPGYREARMQYAIVSEREGNIAAAEEQFRVILSSEPDNAVVLNYLGYSLADRGLKLDEAERFIRRAVELEPGNGAYVDSLGWVFYKKGLHAEALEKLLEASRLINADPVIWEHVGDAYSALGRAREAVSAWTVSLQLETDAKRLAAVRGRLFAELGKLPPAEAGALLAGSMARFLPSDSGYASFCGLEVSAFGRSLKFDGVINYIAPDEFTFTITGPLLAPLWKIKVRGGTVEMDEPAALDGKVREGFVYWAPALAAEMRYFFSGSFFSEPGLAFEGSRRSSALRSGKKKAVLDETGVRFRSLDSGEGMTLSFGGYFARKGYWLPGEIEIKIPSARLKLTVDQRQVNIPAENPLFTHAPAAE
ncbi:MAG: Tetratricopeptide domain-containing protein [Elusimicrobia bacterium]|nr:MAG: Tetratricopeptide domain-containing protein [Elusimicrobiota bacterium]KAF0157026.1 MAG: Tetratricopeptide domain-containing protein [Elusimicrobiota bacterium]